MATFGSTAAVPQVQTWQGQPTQWPGQGILQGIHQGIQQSIQQGIQQGFPIDPSGLGLMNGLHPTTTQAYAPDNRVQYVNQGVPSYPATSPTHTAVHLTPPPTGVGFKTFATSSTPPQPSQSSTTIGSTTADDSNSGARSSTTLSAGTQATSAPAHEVLSGNGIYPISPSLHSIHQNIRPNSVQPTNLEPTSLHPTSIQSSVIQPIIQGNSVTTLATHSPQTLTPNTHTSVDAIGTPPTPSSLSSTISPPEDTSGIPGLRSGDRHESTFSTVSVNDTIANNTTANGTTNSTGHHSVTSSNALSSIADAPTSLLRSNPNIETLSFDDDDPLFPFPYKSKSLFTVGRNLTFSWAIVPSPRVSSSRVASTASTSTSSPSVFPSSAITSDDPLPAQALGGPPELAIALETETEGYLALAFARQAGT